MTTNSKTIFNFMWDRWIDGVTMIYDGQKQMESLLFSSISKQKEIWDVLNNQVDIYSQELQTEMKNYQEKAANIVETISDETTKESITQIQNQLDSILALITKLSLSPQTVMNQLVTENYNRLEKSMKDLINQQAKNRTEIKTMLEQYGEELKTSIAKISETLAAQQNKKLTLTK